MTDLAAIRAREADPATIERAQRKIDLFNERMDKGAASALTKRAGTAKNGRAKVVFLRQMTDLMERAMEGIAPCKKGCNACCHMATLMTVQEAESVAAATGAKMHTPAVYNDLAGKAELRDRYKGVPCPFLLDTGCSIYAVRPLACRMHYVLDVDNLLCTIVPGEHIKVPTLNTIQYDMAMLMAFGGPHEVKYADIREFFPRGAGR